MARKKATADAGGGAMTVYSNGSAANAPRSGDAADEPQADHQAEKLPTVQELVVPAALLLAADSVAAHNDAERPYLNCVFLQAKDGKGRLCGSDGRRVFIASFAVAPGKMPDWMKDGLLLGNENLKARVGMIAKSGEAAQVKLRFADGQPKVAMSDVSESMVFQASPLTGDYPNVDRFIPAASLSALDEDGNPVGREWEPIGINSSYLKHVGDLANTLNAGLEKSARTKSGMIVRSFSAGNDPMTPLLFDFSTWPGAILMISPVRLSGKGISAETAAILSPAIKLTLAALRAHATRNLAWAEGTKDPQLKAQFEAKAATFQERVAVILKNAPGSPALADETPADRERSEDGDWGDRDETSDEGDAGEPVTAKPQSDLRGDGEPSDGESEQATA